MILMENMKDLKCYKTSTYLPTVEGDKKKFSAITLLSPNADASNFLMNHPLFINNRRFESYYIEKDLSILINEKNIKPVEEAYIEENKRSNLDDSEFGIPEDRKYPLDTEQHVRSAIRLFGHAEPSKKKSLAKRIAKRAKDYDIEIPKTTQVYKYLHEDINKVYTQFDSLNDILNESSEDDGYKYFLLSDDYLADNKVLQPKDGKISFYPSIKTALMDFKNLNQGRELFVNVPVEGQEIKASKSDNPSAEVTHEVWFKEPTKVQCIGKIRVGGAIKNYRFEGGSCTSWKYSWLPSQNQNIVNDIEAEEEDSRLSKYSSNDRFAQDREKRFKFEREEDEDDDINSMKESYMTEGFFDKLFSFGTVFTKSEIKDMAKKCKDEIKSYVSRNKYLTLSNSENFIDTEDGKDCYYILAEFDTDKYINDGHTIEGSIFRSADINKIRKDLHFLLNSIDAYKPFTLEEVKKGKSIRYDIIQFVLSINNNYIKEEFEYPSNKAVLEFADSLNTFDKIILFNEDAKHDPILKRYLYKQRLMYRKDILSLYENVKNANPFIRYTYPELSKYMNRNLFIDTYFYTELFFENNQWTLKKGLDLFFDFMERLIKQAELTAKGYKRHTLMVPVKAWDTNKDASVWNYRMSLNPMSIIYYYLYNGTTAKLKKVFGNTDVVFVGQNNYFKLNFSKIPQKDIKRYSMKFKLFLIKICKNEEFDPEDIDTSADNVDSPEVLKAKIVDKIEDSRGVDLTKQVAKASTKSQVAAIKAQPNTKANVEKENEVKPDGKTSKLTLNQPNTGKDESETKKQELADRIESISKQAKDVDQFLNDMDDADIKSLVLSMKPDEDNVNISAGRAARISELDKKFMETNVKGRTIRDILNDNTNKEVVKTDLNISTPNEDWKGLTYTNFDKNYNIDKDIISCFHHLEKTSHPISVKKIDVKDNSTSEDRVELYDVQLEDYRGKQISVKLDIPTMVDNRFLLRGNYKSIQTQFFNMPIIKTEESTCQIISNYMKIFLRRFREGNGRALPVTAQFIKAIRKYKAPGLKISTGDNTKVCSKYQLPIDYIDIAREFTRIETSKYVFYFNQNEIRENYKIDDSKGVPFVYNKAKQTIEYYTDNDKEFTYKLLSYFDDDFMTLVKQQTQPSTCTFSRASIMNSQIPLIVICAYHIGLRATMDRANIKYEIVKSKLKDLKDANYDFIRFSDGYLAYEVNYSSSMLMNGLKECNTSDYPLSSMDDRNTYLEFLDNYGGRIKADGLDNFYDLMIDPMTKESLEFYHMPTDYIGVLLYANNLLVDNKFIKHTDTSSRRIRRYQLIAVYTYKVLADAYASYTNQLKHTANVAQFMVKQSAVIDKFLTDSITSDDSVINALRDIETTNAITTKGPSGMNSDRAYSLDKRTYDDSMLNIVALSTGFAGNIGITRQATLNSNVTPEGYVKVINGQTDKMNTANTLSATEALTPFGTTHDDPFRTAMTFVQTAKHQTRTVDSDPLLVTNGADEAMVYMSSDRFAFKAKSRGKIIELTPDYILVEYTNGDKDYVNLRKTIQKNSDGGYYVDLKLDAVDKLKVGSLVKEGQVLAYDKESYSNSMGESDNLAYNIGKLAKVAVVNTDEGFEDSGIISEKLAASLATRVDQKHDMVLDKDTIVHSLVKVGDHIEAGHPLMVWQSPFEDEDANALIKVLSDKEEVSELGKRSIVSEVTGTVSAIKIFRTVETSELSDSLKRIVNAYEKPLKEMYNKLKENNLDTSVVPAHYVLPATGKLKKAQDAILIEIYVEYQDTVGIGDKVVYYSANKAVEKNIFPKGEEPYTSYRPNEEISALLSETSIAKRMVTSILQIGAMNKMMVELDRHVRDILGIKYDDSSF